MRALCLTKKKHFSSCNKTTKGLLNTPLNKKKTFTKNMAN